MMESIPDAWPPPQPESRAIEVPMFPLPGLFLYPRQVLPLHIFEPRYRTMIEDGLDGPGRLVIGTVLQDSRDRLYSEDSPPEVLGVAGLGEIGRHERLPDGRFRVWLFGLTRVAIEELETDKPYRRVRAVPLLETEPSPAEADQLREPLSRAILDRSDTLLNVPDDTPTSMLADLLCQRLLAPQPALERIYAEPDVAQRARLALRTHGAYPPGQRGS